ncbi:DUF1541 domain-containing protein [Virgibacillus siamensis]
MEPGTKVTLTASHVKGMKGMKGAEATSEPSKIAIVYMDWEGSDEL